MSAALMVHRPGTPPEQVALTGPVSAGGGPDDAVHLEGAPPRTLALTPSPAGVVAEARCHGTALRTGGGPERALPPARRRLLLPGDSLVLAGAVLEALRPPAPTGTSVLAGRLLVEAALGGAPVAGPHLVAVEGPDAGRRVSLRGEATLGRGRGATLRLADAAASRRHARVAHGRDGFTLEDLGSKNGLRLNGAPVGRGPAPLHPGDEIEFGKNVLSLVVPEEGAAGRGPAPAEAGAVAPGTPAIAAPGWSRPPAILAASAALLAGAAALAAAALGG
ncbi:MAG TPA: FHA domain-containing protein [Anaeromyxobacteraceae bacterium]|nr:FHA domain-containing protein [Anaeromyxobacteraceae bacterium]